MSSSMNTILVIGGSGGIGEAFARRFASQSSSKHIIVTGRNTTKLAALSDAVPNISTYTMDMTDLSSVETHFKELTTKYPNIDTVWVNGGVQYSFNFANLSESTDEGIKSELDTNVTGPVLIARYFVPWLLAKGTTTNFMITSSGLAYIPLGVYPVYCPTKAFVHSFLVALRQQMTDTKLNVIEIAPPRVSTDLEKGHFSETVVPSMSLQDFTDQMFEILDNSRAEDLKEVGVGIAAKGIETWRGSFGKILEGMGIQA